MRIDGFEGIAQEHGIFEAALLQALRRVLLKAASFCEICIFGEAEVATELGSNLRCDAVAVRLVVQGEVLVLAEANVLVTEVVELPLFPGIGSRLHRPKEGVEATTQSSVLWSGPAIVPLAHIVGFVSSLLQLLSQACHVPRHAGKARHVVGAVPVHLIIMMQSQKCQVSLVRIAVLGQATAPERASGLCREVVRGVVALQEDALTDQPLQARRLDLRPALGLGLSETFAMPAEARPTQIVR
mmetsp:Transcript_76866/g.184120  ORF Transcript_76866/g.184120 Transcript_76866/m.184120 type:complete len:242 (-) Transcript_76866:214-939(-)